MRIRTTIKIDDDLIKYARMDAANKGVSLSDVIEDSLKKSLPSTIRAEIVGNPQNMNIRFKSTPSISQMQPDSHLEDLTVK